MMHLFNVRFSSAKVNKSMNIVAEDLIKAAERLLIFHPDAKVWQVIHLGRIDDIDIRVFGLD